MYIVLDSSEFISDPWLRSQRWRVFINYAARTRSQLVLLSSVEAETVGHFRRLFRSHAAGLESALLKAKRHELEGVPTIDADALAESTFSKWHRNFESAIQQPRLERPALDNSILPEALRRATERIPPCDHSGKELRDTILWLSLLSFCETLKPGSEVTFVSSNTKDFARSDGDDLKQELRNDLANFPCTFAYFASLEEFNKAHADRIAYLTLDWVRQHLGIDPIAQLVTEYLEATDPSTYLSINDSDYADYYEPEQTVTVHGAEVVLVDCHVWRINREELELGIEFEVDVEADVECRLARQPPGWYGDRVDDARYRYPYSKTLGCFGQMHGVVAARIVDDEIIEAIDLEELNCR